MYINDEYAVDCIISILCNNGNLFQTPNDYCVNYSYEETRSITLEDLRDALEKIIGGSHEK
jgi:hypothetical protein